ncbi:MAG: hypothetical protein ACK5NF_00280 [Bacilli bacterium]
MKIKSMSLNAMLSAMLFTIYFIFSQILYLEFVCFTIIILSMTLPKFHSVIVSVIFVFLVWLSYGIGVWTIMYIIIYPGFAFMLSLIKDQIKNKLSLVATCGFIMALLVGNLIDLPMLLFSKEITIMYVILGLKTTLIQATICCVSLILFYDPIFNFLNSKLTNNID